MFQKINLTIYSPDKTKEITAEVNAILTVSQITEELVKNKFAPAKYNYGLLIEKDGRILSANSTLRSIDDQSIVRMVVFSENQMIDGRQINVTILHPTDNTSMEVELNDTLSVEDVINELIACNFIDDSADKVQYRIFVKNAQTEISGKQTLASGGTIDGSVLSVII